MIDLVLQVWGGAFYLLNKLFFAKAERAATPRFQKKWRLRAWGSYLIGLPPWVFIFICERNWIAAAVESSGVPAMLLGLGAAWRGHARLGGYRWLDHLAKLMVVLGLGLSVYDFGGLVTLNQFLEVGIAAGFLMGTYLLAKARPQGYVWLLVGNLSAAALMLRQGYLILMAQQLVSLSLVIDAWRAQRRKANEILESALDERSVPD